VNLFGPFGPGDQSLEKRDELGRGVTGELSSRTHSPSSLPGPRKETTFHAGSIQSHVSRPCPATRGGPGPIGPEPESRFSRHHTEHRCVLRRIKIQANDVGGLFFQQRIVAGHTTVQPMRLQTRRRPNPLNGRLTETERIGHLAARPRRAAIERSLRGLPGDPCLRCRGLATRGFLPICRASNPLNRSCSNLRFQREIVGPVVSSCVLICSQMSPSVIARIRRARNTSPAGNVRD